MADEYRPLATLFHMDTSTAAPAHLEEIAQARLTADSTFRTGIITKLGELFIGMPRELTRQLNDVLARSAVERHSAHHEAQLHRACDQRGDPLHQ